MKITKRLKKALTGNTESKVVYTIYEGKPRTDKTAKRLETFDNLEDALKKLAEYRYKMKTDNIYIREEVI